MVYDHVVIGTSPVCLLEAIYHQSIGKKVCLIDSSSQIGGSWKTIDFEREEVELGCHIFEKNKQLFNFFSGSLHMDLLKIQPQPKLLIGKIKIPYQLKNFMLVFANLKYYFSYKHGFKTFAINFRIFFKEILQFQLPYYSFKNGSIALLEKLKKEIETRNIDVLLSNPIQTLKLNSDNDSIELIAENGGTIKTNQLTITHSSNFKNIYLGKQSIELNCFERKHDFCHVHLLIKDDSISHFSYLRVFNHNLIHRISDMSTQLKNKQTNEHLICVGIFATAFFKMTKEELVQLIINYLKTHAIISEKAEKLKSNWNQYTIHITDYFDLKQSELLAKHANINCIYTSDFMTGVVNRINDYSKINFAN